MKFRLTFAAAIIIILSACNFTLAEDITPPPNYVPPTPLPTLGPLYPARAPSIENGRAIYAEKCLPCHGETGLGDGEQGIQLGVTVRAFGLPEIARPASPSQYYTAVTRGNLERFMPPFTSLTDQERWDVVAYVLTLHTSDEQIQKGRELFEAHCAGCGTDFFRNQEKMSALSAVELARIVKQGNEEVKAFGSNLSEAEVWAAAEYLRSLSFDTEALASSGSASSSTPVPAAVSQTAIPPAGTASDAATPIGGTPQATAASEATPIPQPGFGTVSGSVENKTGASLPSDLKVTLRGYDHGGDPNSGPQEVLTIDGIVRADGTFAFENVEIPAQRIFIAEVTYEDLPLQSDFAVVEEGAASLTVPALKLYATTTESSALTVDEVRMFFEYADSGIQAFGVYWFRNSSEKIILVTLGGNGEVPFITAPKGSSGIGYEPMQDSERFIPTEKGFAIPPSEGVYSLVAFSSIPRNAKVDFSQTFVLPVGVVTVFAPEGVTIENPQLSDLGVQAIQGFNFQIYESESLGAGETLSFTLSGEPKEASAAAPADAGSNQRLLIGAGVLGLALILAGAWMYLRDRKPAQDDEEEEEAEFESAEEVMDAIIAIDDLHGAKKISDQAYRKRRDELKEFLKGMM